MNRDEMLARLSALDFYAVDMHLYLNTHPDDREALAKYNAVITEAAALRRDYESRFGMLSAHTVSNTIPWPWIADPWPWQKEFNFNLAGDDDNVVVR